YFIVGEVNNGQGQSKMLASRLNTMTPTAVAIDSGPWVSLPNNMLQIGSDVHHFEGLGSFPMVNPGDRAFVAATAARQKGDAYPQHLLLGAKEISGGYAMAFGEADWAGAGALSGLRVGTVNSLAGLDPTKLPLLTFSLGDPPFGGGTLDWFAFG